MLCLTCEDDKDEQFMTVANGMKIAAKPRPMPTATTLADFMVHPNKFEQIKCEKEKKQKKNKNRNEPQHTCEQISFACNLINQNALQAVTDTGLGRKLCECGECGATWYTNKNVGDQCFLCQKRDCQVIKDDNVNETSKHVASSSNHVGSRRHVGSRCLSAAPRL